MNTITLQEPAANPVLEARMTAEERYLFDLQGYLVVPDALSPGQVRDLNAIMDERITASVDADASHHRFHAEGNPLGWGAPYRELMDNPRIMPFVREMVGPHPRLDHDYADVYRSSQKPLNASLHGGGSPFEECCFYAHRDGKIRCGLMVVAYNLHDVNPGEGGFGAVPGSHKANFPFPEKWHGLIHPQPCVTQVPAPAGSAIIFTEALTHGTMPWRGAHERRTLFYKYSPNSISWAAKYYDATAYGDLTAAQVALLEAPNARYPWRFTE